MRSRLVSWPNSPRSFGNGTKLHGIVKFKKMSPVAGSIIWLTKHWKNTVPGGQKISPRMKSRATSKFWNAYSALPANLQRLALKQYRLWLSDVRHPSVNFKKVGRYWSARITDDHRALGVMTGDTVIWFWIGSHAEYERIIKGR